MKKVLFWIVLLIALLAGIIFTSFGQKFVLLPAANLYLRWSVPEHRVVLDRLHPTFNRLESSGTVDGSIRFQVAGPVRWIPLRFDLEYRIKASELILERHRYPLQIDLQGRASGTPEKVAVRGKGKGFDAKLAYRFLLEKKKIYGVRATMEGGEIEQLLVLAGVPPYARGRLDLNADLPKIEGEHPEGSVTFTVREGVLNAKALGKELHVSLPEKERYTLEGRFRMSDGLLRGEAQLKSALLNLDLKNFRGDASFRVFKSDYDLEIPELSRWSKVTGMALYGPMQMGGQLYYDRLKRLMQFKGESESLGGKLGVLYDGSSLSIKLDRTGIPEILALLGQPALVEKGTLDGEIRMAELSKMKGSYLLEGRGTLNRGEVKKFAGIDPGESRAFSFKSQGRLNGKSLDAALSYRSASAFLTVPKLHYTLLGNTLEGSYRLELPDLSKLVGQSDKRKIPLLVQGDLKYLGIKKYLQVRGESGSLGGKIRFDYGGNRLKVELKKVDPSTLMKLAGEPSYLRSARLNGSVLLSDLIQKKGNYTLALDGTANRQVWRKSFDFDPGKSFTLHGKSQGTLAGDLLQGEASLQTPWGTLQLKPMHFSLAKKSFESRYLLKIPKLEKLRPLTKKSYHGPLECAGDLRWDGQKFTITGAGEEWGGRFAYRMEGQRVIAKAKDLEMRSLLKMLGYPEMLDGRAGGSLDYSFATEKGTLKAEILKARLLPGTLTQAASLLLKYDLSKELFDRSVLDAHLEKDQAIFNFRAQSPRFLLTIKKGKIDRNRQRIDALLSIDDRGHVYKVKLQGPLSRPRVLPLMTQALEKKITKVLHKKGLDKKIDKVIPKEIKSGGNPIGDLIHKLF